VVLFTPFYVWATPTLRQNHPAQHYNERNKIFSVGIFYSLTRLIRPIGLILRSTIYLINNYQTS
jgi:hypothetical protein